MCYVCNAGYCNEHYTTTPIIATQSRLTISNSDVREQQVYAKRTNFDNSLSSDSIIRAQGFLSLPCPTPPRASPGDVRKASCIAMSQTMMPSGQTLSDILANVLNRLGPHQSSQAERPSLCHANINNLFN